VPGFIEGEEPTPINPSGSGGASEFVPYIGANESVDLGEFGLSAGFLKLDTTPTNTPTDQGTMYWDEDDNTVDIILNGYIMKVGEDLFYPVKNQTGSSIPKGTNVGFAGTLGMSGRLLITPYLANGANPTSRYMGVTAETIANGADGKVLWFGRIRGINTNAFNEGDILYASTSSAGAFQTTLPVAPNNIVEVAAVITKSSTNGVIFVRPQFLAVADSNKVSYNVADSKNATERNQARVNIGSTSATPQVIATAGAIDDLTITSNSLVFTGASVVLSGIVAALDGEEITILNTNATALSILSQSTLSSANNRIIGAVLVPQFSVVRLKYRTTTARWVLENVLVNDGRYVRKDVNDTKINQLIFDWQAGNSNSNHIIFRNSIMDAYSLNVLGGGTHNWNSWGNGGTGYNFSIGGTLALDSTSWTLSSEGGFAGTIFGWRFSRAVRIDSYLRVQGGQGISSAKGNILIRGYDSTPTLQFSVFSSGRVEHARSGASNESSRRDELYLNYSQTVATAGTINDLAINTDCKLLILTGCDDVTGIVAVDNTRLIRIEARGASRIIRDQSASSTAANRFALGADLTINDGEVYQFIYTNSRWRRVL
jgi:hypothetical protein